MATLVLDNRSVLGLRAENLIGNQAGVDVLVDDAQVSRHHARLSWRKGMWWLTDLASRNGTWVDGRVVEPYTAVRLARDVEVRLSRADGPCLKLEEDRPPSLFAVRVVDGAQEFGDRELVLCESGREVRVHIDEGAWKLDDGDVRRVLSDGEAVLDGAWRVWLPDLRETAVAPKGIATFATSKLILRASAGFRTVSAELVTDERTILLEGRAHWYVIWALADHRKNRDEEGWMDLDRLAIRAEKPRTALDSYISLARRQLLRAGVVGGDKVVEADCGIRRIGLPPEQIELVWPR